MKRFTLATLIIALITTLAFSQKMTQTVRGTIIDTDSKMALIGSTVTILGTSPIIGTTSDVNGAFRLEKVPLGRITLQFSYLGYDNMVIPNTVVNSGKEVVLNISMQESIVKMDEVVVRAYKEKGKALNDMSLISARSVSAEQTKRYAGGFDDPSRILSNFAGVTSTQDGSNDIIVRGNSPKYIQWRLEGIEISNPNHFSDQNSVGGAISALNNNLLATSDFYTGAFSAEYGDVLSGVYDVKLRAGNNEKMEATFGFGALGTDLTLEGPLKKGYGGSFLVNYKYSTISLISDLGLIDLDGTLNFQDAAFKVVLPTKKMGVFSFFGLGGVSNFLLEDVEPDFWATPDNSTLTRDISEDYDKGAHLSNIGMNHTLSINENSFVKTSLSYSGSGIDDDIFKSKTIQVFDSEEDIFRDSIVSRNLDYKSKLKKSTFRGAITYSNKLSARNKIQAGTRYSLIGYDYNQRWFDEDINDFFTAVDFKENISTVSNFINWKHRLNNDITIVAGFHNMNVLLNNKHTLEPRIAVKWKLNNTSALNIGYGNHSKMESIHNYFAKVEGSNGAITEPNKNLGLLKARHYVLGYEKRITKNLLAKIEVYYQDLYDLPVENNDTSYYATINEGADFRYVDLVNEGTGKNYGVELTLERFFSKNYYYLINASLFNSKYKSLEGIERNTQYNGNYLVNVLFGKEFENLGKKKNRTLALNAKLFYGGGKKYIPLLRDDQGNVAVDPANDEFWDYEKAYENKIDDIFQLNISASYKFNRPKATHEIFINLDNITNSIGRLTEYYDADEADSIGHTSQFGIFPNLMYRVYF